MKLEKEQEEKVCGIIGKEAEAIVKELKRGSSISKDAIVNAAKKKAGGYNITVKGCRLRG